MVAGMLMSATAARAFTVDGINYTVKSGIATVTGATSKNITSLTIPATVTYGGKTYPVNFIDHAAFNNYKSLREVIIEESDTYIGSPTYTSSTSTNTNTSPFVGCPIESYWIGRDICKKNGNSISLDIMRMATTASEISLTFTGGTTYVMNLASYHSTLVGKVTSVTLGGNIKEVHNKVFSTCPDIRSLTLLPGNAIGLSNSWFPTGFELDTLNLVGNQYVSSYSSITNFPVKHVVFSDNWTEIPESMFQLNKTLETAKLGDNIERIGRETFSDCTSLVYVAFPKSLKTIDAYAFYNCSELLSPDFNEGLEMIDGLAFYGCKSFTDIIFPGSLKSLGANAFYESSNVNKIIFKQSIDNTPLQVKDYSLAVGEIDSLIVNRVIECPSYTTTFSGCEPKHVVLGECWINVPDRMLDGCKNLETVALGPNVETIGDKAFHNCESLISVNYPPSLKEIGNYAFYYCSKLVTPKFNEGLEMIGVYAFYSCNNITELKLPGSLKSVKGNAFSNTDNVNVICIESADDNSALHMDSSALGNSQLDSLIVNRLVETSSSAAFNNCKPKHVVLGDSWIELPGLMFNGVSTLKTVSLGANVTKIGYLAFSACNSITDIFSNATVPPVCNSEQVFDLEIYRTATLHVPAGSKNAYSASEVWRKFENIIAEGVQPGDVNNDGFITTVDINTMISGYLSPESITLTPAVADMNGDGEINTIDINILITNVLNNK